MAIRHKTITDPGDWRDRARCADTDTNMFPTDGNIRPALNLCSLCPVREPCLEYALANRIDHGIWGGKSERERRRILKARREQVA